MSNTTNDTPRLMQ